MNTLTTIGGNVVDGDSKPPKPQGSSMLARRALSAGRGGRVPPSYKEAERSLSPPPKKFMHSASSGGSKNRSFLEDEMGSPAPVQRNAVYADAREEIEPAKKAHHEIFPDDASRDEASIDSGPRGVKGIRNEPKYFERTASAGQEKEPRSGRKYIERSASAGRERYGSRDRFHVEYRPRYRDQASKPRRYNGTTDGSANNGHLDRRVSVDTSEIEPPPAPPTVYTPKSQSIPGRNVQTGMQETVSVLTAPSPQITQGKIYSQYSPSANPRNAAAQGVLSGTSHASAPAPITPETGYQTPKNQFIKSYSGSYADHSAKEEGANQRKEVYESIREEERREQARLRLRKQMNDIDSRLKGRRHYEAPSPRSVKPWEVMNEREHTHHVLNGVPDEDQSKLVVPPLMDEDGVWRDPTPSPHTVYRSSPTSMGSNVEVAHDDGALKSLQSRVEYYKTCLKSNEKKLDELIDSEMELKETLKKQQEQYESQQKQDSELHEKEMEEVKSAMSEAKKAIDALESTIEKLNEASTEKDECISDLKVQMNALDLELKESVVINEKRVTEYEKQVTELLHKVSEKDDLLLSLENKAKQLEEDLIKVTDSCTRTEAAFKSSCKSIKEKEQLLVDNRKEMEQEKDDLIHNFEMYREDLANKMEKTATRMDAIVQEKDNLIESLHGKVKLLESSLAEKDEELKQIGNWTKKEEKLTKKMMAFTLALSEKDKEISNFQRLLEHEKKMHAAGLERVIKLENELDRCQEELNKEKKEHADDKERLQNAKKLAKAYESKAKAYESKAPSSKKSHTSSRTCASREPKEDPPSASKKKYHVVHRVHKGREDKLKSPRHHPHRSSKPSKFDDVSIASIEYNSSEESDSCDSIFYFSN